MILGYFGPFWGHQKMRIVLDKQNMLKGSRQEKKQWI